MGFLGSVGRPLSVAVVGAGPSGFYAAETLLNGQVVCSVDVFDRLPAPFGLVRYGVAPDHPKIKSVTKVFEKVAAHPHFNFWGNVHIGKDVTVEELRDCYDIIVFTCGAQTDKRLGIPGEDLRGSYTATEFVAWYNGHPDYRDRQFDLSQEVAVVIGQGNVSMDVSRILCKSADELKNTDIAQHALESLSQSKLKEVHLIGRRGPAQAAFTPPEIKEMGELHDCDVLCSADELLLNSESEQELADGAFPNRRRNYDILTQYAQRLPSGKKRKLVIHFLRSPKELQGNARVERVILERNALSGETGNQQAIGTGKLESLDCGIVFRSVGYRGVPIKGVPFDDRRGVFANLDGRIAENGKVIPGLYCSGWIKRGPSGVIGTNKADSDATVRNIWADLAHLPACANPDSERIRNLLEKRNVQIVSFQDWKKIDAAEASRGLIVGKPREKFTRVSEMLNSVTT